MDKISIGSRIRGLRIAKGYTQEELAENLDLSTAFVGQIERGEKKISTDTLIKFSRFFVVATDYILFGAGSYDSVETIDDLKIQINDESHQNYANQMLDLLRAIIDGEDKKKKK